MTTRAIQTGISGATPPHQPVLAQAALKALAPHNGGIYVDATFGGGGYSRLLLGAAATRVIGVDRDPAAIESGRALAKDSSERLTLIEGRFSHMDRLLGHLGIGGVHGIVFDLGISSTQLDNPQRGFSFRHDGPLDMRMGRGGPSAADVVNKDPPDSLRHIIRTYGEEPMAGRIARAIVEARGRANIESTHQLATIVRAVVPRTGKKIDPATRTFQALRIHVNDEISELDGGLQAAENLLLPGGRLAVVSFHSLEDRRVKTFLRNRAGLGVTPSRHQPVPRRPDPSFHLTMRRAIKPTSREIAQNRRARSARLRWAQRTPAPPWHNQQDNTQAGGPMRQPA